MALVRELFGEEPKTYYIDDITPTKIPFDTADPADFEIDILSEDIPRIMRFISKNPSYEEFEKFIDELVDDMADEYRNSNVDMNEKPNKNKKANEKGNEKPHIYNTYQCEAGQKRTNHDKVLMALAEKKMMTLRTHENNWQKQDKNIRNC